MNLQYRIDLLNRLGEYILHGDHNHREDGWKQARERAGLQNNWFIPAFVELAAQNIARNYLQRDILEKWVDFYQLPERIQDPKTVGIVMAGNIPLVGFHDFLGVFISGHKTRIKTSTKDDVLIKHLIAKMCEWDQEVSELVQFSDILKGCDAYIATGSNNSAGYFEYYFGRFPNLIRRNRTSVAILTGDESFEDLQNLASDVYLYFGLGCRNVTKLYVPEGYHFESLLEAFKKYNHLIGHHKYKHNYDYNLALHILNKKEYMSNDSLLLVEEDSLFSPISQLNYSFYKEQDKLAGILKEKQELQCIVGKGYVPFGQSQSPAVDNYADGVDTLQFLSDL